MPGMCTCVEFSFTFTWMSDQPPLPLSMSKGSPFVIAEYRLPYESTVPSCTDESNPHEQPSGIVMTTRASSTVIGMVPTGHVVSLVLPSRSSIVCLPFVFA